MEQLFISLLIEFIGWEPEPQDVDFVDTYTEHEDFERDAYFAHNSFTMGEIL